MAVLVTVVAVICIVVRAQQGKFYKLHHFILVNAGVSNGLAVALFAFASTTAAVDLCFAVTVFTHYLVLVAFVWLVMLAKLRLSIARNGAKKDSKMSFAVAAAVSYIVPAVIVGATVAATRTSDAYVNANVCWPSAGIGTSLSVPVCMCMCACTCVCTLVRVF